MIDELMQRENYVLAKKLLDVSHARQQAIASNLANIETPGYKRVDISPTFEAELRRAASTDNPREISSLQARMEVDLQTPSVRPDGNNVQIDSELLKMQKNAVQYEFLAHYTSTSLSRLKTAITGKA